MSSTSLSDYPTAYFLHRELKVITSLDNLVSCAWQQNADPISQPLTVIFKAQDTATDSDSVLMEMLCSSSEMGLARVIIIRDVTDRIRVEMHQAEIERKCRDVAMERDNEANRFIRHEVKNGLLAALVQCDHISNRIESTAIEPSVSVPQLMCEMRSGLDETLEVVLSHPVAIELVHGTYQPRLQVCYRHARESLQRTRRTFNVPHVRRRLDVSWRDALTSDGVSQFVQIEEVLMSVSRSYGSLATMSLMPSVLPSLETDPALLKYIHGNALSNAVKYGQAHGPVATEVEYLDGELIVRVTNKPGQGYDRLLALADPRVVFEKGARIHEGTAAEKGYRTSAGDGAWIMQLSAQALGGSCRIKASSM